MSLLWRNHLRIGLCPDRIIIAGQRRGLRQKAVERDIVPVESRRDPAHWQAAIDALPAVLERCERSKLEVTVILSNHFVRYALLPWNAALKTEAEWESLARHRLGGVYGASAEDWVLQASRTATEGPRVVCAADRPMLEAIAETVTASGATLVSVQPYLMSAFNRVRSMIAKQSCWLVLEERGRLTLALFERGGWHAIRSRRVDGDWQALLPEILERERALLCMDEPCTQAFVYSEAQIESWSCGAYRFMDLTLPTGAKSSDRQFAMALG